MKKLNNKRILIKLGGSILEDNQVMKNLCRDVRRLKDEGAQVILVHGGGKYITKTLHQHNLKTNFLEGLRVTPKEHMELIQMALYMVNKKITKTFSSISLEGVGISGEDSNLLTSNFIDKDKYGYVGSIKEINPSIILKTLAQGLVPIVSTISLTDTYESVNVNADNVASEMAIICDVDELIYLTDQEGVLDKSGKLIPNLVTKDIEELTVNKTVIGGMGIKLNSVKSFLNCSKKNITILNGKQEEILLNKFIKEGEGNYGTTCRF
ncbi:acetylglutamate kinase [Francisella sp. Scap27]|uniref:acetylglutamate kinase n=1 Tax=Francisella sp. Scap27 TaxID=2589986 RepID=UPI0015BBCF8E|nr:acetylglutamate kinase [Francisella sp. Scap27]QLE79447.1 acetylglutamate kinase [Francisella sp. Scap27]